MLTACDLMTRHPVTAKEDDSLDDARSLFESRQIRHLPILRGRRLVGILSHRDLVKCWPHPGERSAQEIPVKEAMTAEVIAVRLDTPLRDVIDLVLEERIGCVPVTDTKISLVGVITATDLVRMAKTHTEDEDLRQLAAEYEA